VVASIDTYLRYADAVGLRVWFPPTMGEGSAEAKKENWLRSGHVTPPAAVRPGFGVTHGYGEIRLQPARMNGRRTTQSRVLPFFVCFRPSARKNLSAFAGRDYRSRQSPRARCRCES